MTDNIIKLRANALVMTGEGEPIELSNALAYFYDEHDGSRSCVLSGRTVNGEWFGRKYAGLKLTDCRLTIGTETNDRPLTIHF